MLLMANDVYIYTSMDNINRNKYMYITRIGAQLCPNTSSIGAVTKTNGEQQERGSSHYSQIRKTEEPVFLTWSLGALTRVSILSREKAKMLRYRIHP